MKTAIAILMPAVAAVADAPSDLFHGRGTTQPDPLPATVAPPPPAATTQPATPPVATTRPERRTMTPAS